MQEQKLIESIKTYANKLQTAITEREASSSDTDPAALRKSQLDLLEALSNVKVMQSQYDSFITSFILEGKTE